MKPLFLFGISCLLIILNPLVTAAQSRELKFSGYTWKISDGNATMNHTNLWKYDKEMQFVDAQGKLHLKMKRIFGVWYCSQIQLDHSLGLGKYEFCIDNQLTNLDKRTALSIFLNDDQNNDGLIEASKSEAEINITFSRWNKSNNANCWYIVKPLPTGCIGKCPPDNTCGGMQCYSLNNNAAKIISSEINWISRSSVVLTSYLGRLVNAGKINYNLAKKQFKNVNLPKPGIEKLTISVWFFGGNQPEICQKGEEMEVIISQFRFTPLK